MRRESIPASRSQPSRKRELRADVNVADLFEQKPIPSHDLVLLVHVIEHFRSPHRALDAIRKLLPEGGRLYVECPNFGAPVARDRSCSMSRTFTTSRRKRSRCLAQAMRLPRRANVFGRRRSELADVAGSRSKRSKTPPIRRATRRRWTRCADRVRCAITCDGTTCNDASSRWPSYSGRASHRQASRGQLLERCREFEKPVKLRMTRAA